LEREAILAGEIRAGSNTTAYCVDSDPDPPCM
jgi:hypothetical protein